MFFVLIVELCAAAALKRCFCPKFVGRTILWSYSFLAWEVCIQPQGGCPGDAMLGMLPWGSGDALGMRGDAVVMPFGMT